MNHQLMRHEEQPHPNLHEPKSNPIGLQVDKMAPRIDTLGREQNCLWFRQCFSSASLLSGFLHLHMAGQSSLVEAFLQLP